MVERQKSWDIDTFRKSLVIDKDDLDTCLVQQPELFDHVAEAHSMAVAERDATKLALEEAEAWGSQQIREEYAEAKIKTTEGDIKEKLITDKKLGALRRTLLQQKAEVDRWAALKESYQQRSYMLKELAPMKLARMFSSGSVSTSSRDMADAFTRKELDAARAQRGYKRDR
jgi:hypothetical protein